MAVPSRLRRHVRSEFALVSVHTRIFGIHQCLSAAANLISDYRLLAGIIVRVETKDEVYWNDLYN